MGWPWGSGLGEGAGASVVGACSHCFPCPAFPLERLVGELLGGGLLRAHLVQVHTTVLQFLSCCLEDEGSGISNAVTRRSKSLPLFPRSFILLRYFFFIFSS